MHYRRLRKHGSTAVPQRVNKPGPKPKPGATSHQRLDPEEKRRRAEERAAQKAAETHCDNGHEWKPETTYVYPEGSRYPGKRICKVCRMNWQRERQGLPLVDSIGPWNRDKTHCPQGHEYSEENTLKKNDGSRGCKTCHVHGWRSRMYGVDVEKYAQMMEDQGEACAICDAPFTPENLAHIDHCHDSGKVRGLLCNNCNNGIGRFKDDVARLRAAISYLESHQQ
jgi:hypothetical protein